MLRPYFFGGHQAPATSQGLSLGIQLSLTLGNEVA